MTSSLPGYASHFGISNIPFGIASSVQHSEPQCTSRYEDDVIFLADISKDLGDIQELPKDVFSQPTLNDFAALPRSVHQAVREKVQQLLKSSGIASSAIEPISAVTMHLPVRCNDFSDFSCSSDHVENASEAMTGTRSHPPSFFHQPVGYAGRCSSLDVSGTSQVRPLGQYWSGKPGNSEIVFGPSKRMDYELEVGAIIGRPVPRRQRLMAKDASEHIFGFVLVNDWSGKCILLNNVPHKANHWC
jgi:fumarylacetoacetase